MKLKEEYAHLQELYNKGFRFNPDDETFFVEKSDKKFKLPTDFENWNVQKFNKDEYLNTRIQELGIEKSNTVTLIEDKSKSEYKIFTANKYGDIEILQYNLHRAPYKYEKKTTSAGTKFEYNVQLRLNPLYADILNGKYDFSEAKNCPFWHPDLIEKFENKEVIDTLIITEGQFKAFKATNDGIPTVGITSISHFRDKEFKTLHPEIIEFIRVCEVKNIVILWDGDCTDISYNAIEKKEDLAKRPSLFYHFACKISDLVHDFFPNKKLKTVYFSTIKSSEIEHNPKGIDDLLTTNKTYKKQIVQSFNNIGLLPSLYIDWLPISTEEGKKKVRKFFNLQSVQAFYGFHAEKINGRDFVFQGSSYKIVKGLPVIEIPKDLKSYKRIGTDYYSLQKKPIAKTGMEQIDRMYEEILAPWTLPAIKSDHGKDADNYIERYKGFTNEASHTDYQQVIDGYWNLYANIQHEVEKGEFPMITKLLKHLFQEHFDNEMIFDYFSVLYKFPWQKLPVICLVSKQQATGKSTFIYLLKLIFKQNMAIISNNDLTADFNSHWTSKLVVASEETLLEKKDGYEKIKSLTTAKEILRNEKNKTAQPIPCMVHFVFCSNHENDFIRIDDYDSRLWIRKVGTITEKIKKFDQLIENEIPYFIEYIQSREIKYKDSGERLFFHPMDFRTEAFKNVVAHSEPGVIKDLRIQFEDYFLKFRQNEISLTTKDLRQYFGARGDDFYLNKLMREYFHVEKNATSSTYSFLNDNPNDPDKPISIKGKGRFMTFKAKELGIMEQETTEVEQEDSVQENLPF